MKIFARPIHCLSLAAMVLAAVFCNSDPAHAQSDSVSYYEEQNQLKRGSRGVSALGNQMFGDKVDLYTGALQFVHTDVSLP